MGSHGGRLDPRRWGTVGHQVGGSFWVPNQIHWQPIEFGLGEVLLDACYIHTHTRVSFLGGIQSDMVTSMSGINMSVI